MIEVTRGEISESLKSVGIDRGDTVLVFSNLGRIGKIKGAKTKNESLKTYLDALSDSVGMSKGTIVVPTFTYSFAKGKPFIYEESPSELCMFGEYLRKQTMALRSFHPHFSFAAIGADRHAICDDISRSAFGCDSVFDRLYKRGAKILFLGTNITEGLTFIFYIEHMTGISHCYHKAYFTPVFREGREAKGPFFSFVRHLIPDFHTDLAPFEKHLKEIGLVRESPLGSGKIQLVESRKVFDAGYKKLQENPCYFFHRDFYITT